MAKVIIRNRSNNSVVKTFNGAGYKVFAGKVHVYKSGQGKGATELWSGSVKTYTWSSK